MNSINGIISVIYLGIITLSWVLIISIGIDLFYTIPSMLSITINKRFLRDYIIFIIISTIGLLLITIVCNQNILYLFLKILIISLNLYYMSKLLNNNKYIYEDDKKDI